MARGDNYLPKIASTNASQFADIFVDDEDVASVRFWQWRSCLWRQHRPRKCHLGHGWEHQSRFKSLESAAIPSSATRRMVFSKRACTGSRLVPAPNLPACGMSMHASKRCLIFDHFWCAWGTFTEPFGEPFDFFRIKKKTSINNRKNARKRLSR